MAELPGILKSAVAKGASDLHIVVGKPPMVRVYGAIEAGAKHGMISMDQHLAFLVKQNLITAEQAIPKAHDPSNLQKLLAMGRQA